MNEEIDADGNIILTGSEGDDNITVTEHTSSIDLGFMNLEYVDGVTVSDGTSTHTYLGEDASHLTIQGLGGDDRITVDADVSFSLTLEGGAGEDRIQGGAGADVMRGGDGRDYLEGGAGNDTLDGGRGDDIVYGGQGNDTLSGGRGDDYLEGGKGDDALKGGAGNDTLSGGRGDDRVEGGAGNDTMYGGGGTDRLAGNAGNDVMYGDASDVHSGGAGNDKFTDAGFREDLGTSIKYTDAHDADGNLVAEGTLSASDAAAFRDRVEDDIDLLRSSPSGQQLLTSLDDSGHDVTMQRIDNDNGYAIWNNFGQPGDVAPTLDASGNPGTGQDVTVGYNPNIVDTFGGKDETPVEVLYHELSHAHNEVHGTLQTGSYTGPDANDTGISNFERQAVGLDNTGATYDHDNDPSTPDSRDNPEWATERGMSEELRREQRGTYSN